MNRNLILLALCFCLSATLIGQEAGVRDLDAFNAIKVATGIDATIIAGTKNEIQLTAKGIELDEIKSSINKGELVVRVKNNIKFWKHPKVRIEAIITYNSELTSIAVNSGASIYSEGSVTSQFLELTASSGSDLELDIVCEEVDAIVNTGADMDLKGETSRIELKFNTGASFRGFDLQAGKARVKGGTGATAELTVEKYIKTNINTGASLEYKGNPSKKYINKGTGGDVRQISSGI